MSTPTTRDRLAIVKEIHALTVEMGNKQQEPDFLVEAIDRREELMNEYDKVNALLPPLDSSEKEQATFLIQEVIRMDQRISGALTTHKDEAKADLKKSNGQQRLLGYVNQAMSASGTYMDYKK